MTQKQTLEASKARAPKATQTWGPAEDASGRDQTSKKGTARTQ